MGWFQWDQQKYVMWVRIKITSEFEIFCTTFFFFFFLVWAMFKKGRMMCQLIMLSRHAHFPTMVWGCPYLPAITPKASFKLTLSSMGEKQDFVFSFLLSIQQIKLSKSPLSKAQFKIHRTQSLFNLMEFWTCSDNCSLGVCILKNDLTFSFLITRVSIVTLYIILMACFQ